MSFLPDNSEAIFISILENVQSFLILSGDVLIMYCISVIMVEIHFAKTVIGPVCWKQLSACAKPKEEFVAVLVKYNTSFFADSYLGFLTFVGVNKSIFFIKK